MPMWVELPSSTLTNVGEDLKQYGRSGILLTLKFPSSSCRALEVDERAAVLRWRSRSKCYIQGMLFINAKARAKVLSGGPRGRTVNDCSL